MKWIESRMQTWIAELQRHAESWWYAPLIGLLAGLDHFIIVVPTDGLTVSAVLLHPKKWVQVFLMVAIGSTIGATAFAWAVKAQGLPILIKIMPGILESGIWRWTEGFMNEYGGLALLGVAMSPLIQHPAVALAALSKLPLEKIFGIILLGRLIKFGLVCWITSHMPHLILRLWGVRKEVVEVAEVTPQGLPGISVPSDPDSQIAASIAGESIDQPKRKLP